MFTGGIREKYLRFAKPRGECAKLQSKGANDGRQAFPCDPPCDPAFLHNSGIDVIFIPAGCTSVCQVMDVVVNRPFKAHVRNSYISWRAAQITDKHPWVAPKRGQVIDWVLDSWHQFPLESLRDGVVQYVLTRALA